MGMPVSKRQWFRATVGLVTAGFVSIVAANAWVTRSTASAIYSELNAVPVNNVGLVLGTSQQLKNGTTNWHFRARIFAAAELYRTGKVKHLLLSGDNHVKTYDEPTDMKNALLALGVPESAMTLDYAGFRTLDSVIRAKKIFGQQKLTIITDDFHTARAVFIARHEGVEAIAFSSGHIPLAKSFRSRMRECGARVLAVTDVCVLHRQPKFLGDKIKIQLSNRPANKTLPSA